MGRIKELVVVSAGFPNKKCIYKYKFLEQLVNEFVRLGIKVAVISPVYNNHYQDYYKEVWSYNVEGSEVIVYQPLIMNYSTRTICGIRLGELSYTSFKKAVKKTIIKEKLKPDVLYSHFITPSGCVIAELGMELGIPSFCAVGESNIKETFQALGEKYIQERFKNISGVISVSSENEDEIRRTHLCDCSPLIVLPNGVNQEVFYRRNKYDMRKKYGFVKESVIGIFVGAFIDRKGVKRVQSASDMTGTKMIYVGSGTDEPSGRNVIFKGIVSHEKLPELLSAADFFVLPTKAEGCCNAIIEAISCGLPIISSNRRFNDDILLPDYSIRIDSDNVDELAGAILKLSNDEQLRIKMSMASLSIRQRFDIKMRAYKILSFMEEYA